MPSSTITLSLNCFKVPFIQKYWKTSNYENHCIFKQTWPKFQNMIIFTHFIHLSYLGTKFRNFALSICDQHQFKSCNLTKMLARMGFTLLRFFEKFSFSCWLLLLNQSMAPISSLTWHLKKSGKDKNHNCLDLFCVLSCTANDSFFFVCGFCSRNIQ